MSTPDAQSLLATLEATWPPAGRESCQGWLMRDGAGGGKRVSATSPLTPDADILQAEAAMRARRQRPLFRLTDTDAALDAALGVRGYRVLDPTLIYLAPVADLARKPGPVRLFTLWPPLAIMREIWAAGGIGPGRLAVMERAPGPKTGLVARIDDRAAGVGFCALAGDIAMLHAVEVQPAYRRKGVGALILSGAAHWAEQAGAQWMALAVTQANAGACALYEGCGMMIAARYHYREEGPDDRESDRA